MTSPDRRLDLSVIVCTHNPRPDYFARCLDGLSMQTLPTHRWELVVIDNASERMHMPAPGISWHPSGTLLREERLGLTSARIAGIRVSKGAVLVFVDDDNVLDSEFLEVANRVAEEKQFLGAWSGQCRPAFDESPPPWTRRYWGNLAIREFEADIWSNVPRYAYTMPLGAGMCVRRNVALRYLARQEAQCGHMQLDRQGTSLLSGGDNDLAATACELGMGLGLIASLRLTHLIPPWRLTEDYLARLAEGIHFSTVILDHQANIAIAPRSLAGRVMDGVRVLRTPRPHRSILRAAYRGRNRGVHYLRARGHCAAKPQVDRP